MIAYSPFGSPDLPWGEKMPHILADPILTRIAAKYKRSTANVALRWLLQRGLATIPKVIIRKIANFAKFKNSDNNSIRMFIRIVVKYQRSTANVALIWLLAAILTPYSST